MRIRRMLMMSSATMILLALGLAGTASAAGAPAPQVAVTYTINVATSDVEDAGTDSTVEVRLHGSLASSGYMVLDSSIDNYERSSINTFTRVLTDLGTLQSADVRFTVSGGSPAWHLSHITVAAPSRPVVQFVCHCWFNNTSSRTLPAAFNPQFYTIRVTTSDIEDAGTDGTVEVRLRGSVSMSMFMVLDSSIDNYERNTTNNFVRVLTDIGTPQSVDVRFTRTGDSPAWHLSHITLSASGRTTTQFPCHCWFSSSTTRNLPVA